MNSYICNADTESRNFNILKWALQPPIFVINKGIQKQLHSQISLFIPFIFGLKIKPNMCALLSSY